jgi:coenzyme F420-reducing hydrogenase gamma subunit
MDTENKKLKIGWFSFTCCEDSTIIMTELLNEYFFEWKKLLDIKHARVLKRNNVLDELDVAFVEGAISSDLQAQKLKKIRDVSKKLVAIGSCAVTGLPAGQRNYFDEKTKAEIQPILEKFQYAEKVKKLDEVVKVDHLVPGCPMETDKFLELLDQLLNEFGIISENSENSVDQNIGKPERQNN